MLLCGKQEDKAKKIFRKLFKATDQESKNVEKYQQRLSNIITKEKHKEIASVLSCLERNTGKYTNPNEQYPSRIIQLMRLVDIYACFLKEHSYNPTKQFEDSLDSSIFLILNAELLKDDKNIKCRLTIFFMMNTSIQKYDFQRDKGERMLKFVKIYCEEILKPPYSEKVDDIVDPEQIERNSRVQCTYGLNLIISNLIKAKNLLSCKEDIPLILSTSITILHNYYEMSTTERSKLSNFINDTNFIIGAMVNPQNTGHTYNIIKDLMDVLSSNRNIVQNSFFFGEFVSLILSSMSSNMKKTFVLKYLETIQLVSNSDVLLALHMARQIEGILKTIFKNDVSDQLKKLKKELANICVTKLSAMIINLQRQVDQFNEKNPNYDPKQTSRNSLNMQFNKVNEIKDLIANLYIVFNSITDNKYILAEESSYILFDNIKNHRKADEIEVNLKFLKNILPKETIKTMHEAFSDEFQVFIFIILDLKSLSVELKNQFLEYVIARMDYLKMFADNKTIQEISTGFANQISKNELKTLRTEFEKRHSSKTTPNLTNQLSEGSNNSSNTFKIIHKLLDDPIDDEEASKKIISIIFMFIIYNSNSSPQLANFLLCFIKFQEISLQNDEYKPKRLWILRASTLLIKVVVLLIDEEKIQDYFDIITEKNKEILNTQNDDEIKAKWTPISQDHLTSLFEECQIENVNFNSTIDTIIKSNGSFSAPFHPIDFRSPNLHPVDSLHPNQALEDHPVSDSDESSPSVKILSSRKNKISDIEDNLYKKNTNLISNIDIANELEDEF